MSWEFYPFIMDFSLWKDFLWADFYLSLDPGDWAIALFLCLERMGFLKRSSYVLRMTRLWRVWPLLIDSTFLFYRNRERGSDTDFGGSLRRLIFHFSLCSPGLNIFKLKPSYVNCVRLFILSAGFGKTYVTSKLTMTGSEYISTTPRTLQHHHPFYNEKISTLPFSDWNKNPDIEFSEVAWRKKKKNKRSHV